MTPSGRLAAAIEVLVEVDERRQPIRNALKAWGDRSRFAGAKDRAWVSGLALDALRHRRSLAWMIGAETPRGIALAALRFAWGWEVDAIAEAAAGAPHAAAALPAS